MKVRNKKTGLKGTLTLIDFNIDDDEKEIDLSILLDETDGECIDKQFYSLDDLKNYLSEWEEYETVEPLIKDPKIRKAVRAWAEANNVPHNVKLRVFEYLGSGTTVIRYKYKAKTLPDERSVQFEYISSDEIYNYQNDREYTIAELCGSEE